jgi:hypothetical protein
MPSLGAPTTIRTSVGATTADAGRQRHHAPWTPSRLGRTASTGTLVASLTTTSEDGVLGSEWSGGGMRISSVRHRRHVGHPPLLLFLVRVRLETVAVVVLVVAAETARERLAHPRKSRRGRVHGGWWSWVLLLLLLLVWREGVLMTVGVLG